MRRVSSRPVFYGISTELAVRSANRPGEGTGVRHEKKVSPFALKRNGGILMTPICRLCGHHEKTGRTRCARLVRFKLENRVVDRSSESHNDGDRCTSRAIVADLKYKEIEISVSAFV